MADIIFLGQFIASKAGKTGLTPTVDVDRYTIADGTRTALVTAGSATEGRRGLYHYRLAAADLSLYQYVATFITSDATVDQQEVAGIGIVIPDALVGSRLATSGYTAPLDAAGIRTAIGLAAANLDTQLSGIAAAVWAYTTRTLTSLSALVSSIATAVWTYATRTLTSTAAATTAAVSGSVLTLTKYARYTATLSGLTIPADWEWLDFTAKVDVKDADSAAILRLRVSNPGAVTDGLLRLEGAAGTLADGSLTVDQAGGTVTIAVNEDATSLLDTHERIPYDVKVMSTSAGPSQLTESVLSVKDMVTQATS